MEYKMMIHAVYPNLKIRKPLLVEPILTLLIKPLLAIGAL